MDPHLDENKKMLKQIISEPKMKIEPDSKLSPRDRSEHNKSVINQEQDPLKKNFFQENTKRSEERLRKMTRSMIRKQFEQDQEKKTEKSINLSPSINNSSDLLRIKIPEKSMLAHTSIGLLDKNTKNKYLSQRTQEAAPSPNFQIQGIGHSK